MSQCLMPLTEHRFGLMGRAEARSRLVRRVLSQWWWWWWYQGSIVDRGRRFAASRRQKLATRKQQPRQPF